MVVTGRPETSGKESEHLPREDEMTDIERDSVKPIYEQIADQLRQQIVAGGFKAGRRLPTEPEFMREYGVSRSTVRAALALLEQEGRLARRSGKGTFVTHPELEQDLSDLRSFPEAMAAQGFVVTLKPVRWEVSLPPEEVRRQLGLEQGQNVVRIERVHLFDDEPVVADCLSMPAWVSDRVAVERLLTNSTYEVLETEAGLSLGAAWQRVSAAAASRRIASLLNITTRDPILQVERLTYTASGLPIEYLTLHYRADLVVLNAYLPRHSLPMAFEPSMIASTPAG
jgi:GntR family transcriptional regulator